VKEKLCARGRLVALCWAWAGRLVDSPEVGFACSAAPLARDANNDHISHRRVDAIERKKNSSPSPQVRSRFRVSPLPSSNELLRSILRSNSGPIRQVRADFSSLPMHTVCIWSGPRGLAAPAVDLARQPRGREGFLINFDRRAAPRRRFPRSLGRFFSFLVTPPHR